MTNTVQSEPASPSSGAAASASTAPAPVGRRDLSPDVARGLALLGIAIVNAQLLAPHLLVDAADHVSAAFVTVFLENRSWPMFALLFGFGIAAIAARMDAAGATSRARTGVLIRRNLWLALFGLVQVILVFWGDILAVYGLTGMVVIALMNRSKTIRTVFIVLSVVTWTLGIVLTGMDPGADVVPSSPDYLASIVERLGVFAFWTGSNTILLTHLAPMLIGVALYRVGALHRPAEHRPLLRKLAVGGLLAGVLGAVPLALIVGGLWQADDLLNAAALGLHAATGLASGVAYVSLIALWSASRTPDAPVRGPLAVLVAVGQRPLTSYLLHSVLLGLTLSVWAFNLAPQLSAAATYGLGILVWIVCAIVAWSLSAAGRQGPADALLRRLAYGPRSKRS